MFWRSIRHQELRTPHSLSEESPPASAAPLPPKTSQSQFSRKRRKNLGKAAAAKNELLLLALDGVGGRDEQLGLALVLHPAVPAPVQCVGEVRGQLVGELVHVFARENPSGVLVPQVGGEDVKVLVEETLKLLVGDCAACFHLNPLDAQGARQLQSDASEGSCLQYKHL